MSTEPDPALPRALMVVGVVMFCLVSCLSGVLEVLLVPFYIGRYVAPFAVAIALVGNVVLPRMVTILVGSTRLVALPIAVWVLTVLVIGFGNNGGGDVMVPGYGQGQYVALALLFGGALAGAIGVVREVTRASI